MQKRIRKTILQAVSNFFNRMDEGNSPRWIIYIIDLIIVEFSIIFAFLLRFNFHLGSVEKQWLLWAMAFILIVRGGLSLIFKTYAHVIRYTASMDVMRLIVTVSFGSFILLSISMIIRQINPFTILPLSVIIIETFLTIYLLTNMRLALKFIYRRSIPPLKQSNPVLIFGSKEKAVLTREALEIDRSARNQVVAFVDTNDQVNKNRLAGLPLINIDKLEGLIVKHSIQAVILAKIDLLEQHKERIATLCNDYNVKLMHAPESWMNSDSPRIEMKEVNIEELLTRDPINLDKRHLHKYLKGKSILVTGAAGSIGSELVRQITRYKPRQLILLDQAESGLYELELELNEKLESTRNNVILADILQNIRIEKVFDVFRPDIVYHAAAYKHVPMLENNPIEAFMNNVEGTRIVADLANRFGTQKFIMVSTDKAVNPTGVMGATKRIAEMYVQSLNEFSNTNFITTRFGNVLNSSGSAIPRFIKQINQGGPVTVTHPEITRYFMTIGEACQLVLEASVMGNGGEIYLFDMGTPVKISDLVKRLIGLTGHTENDIDIKYTGLREGEKLFEELLLLSEPNKPTYHPKIMVADVVGHSYASVVEQISEVSSAAKLQDTMKVVQTMKQMVPTYKSKNSVFETLDTK
ncbi:polysaccharide biosynthesis protein [Bacteroidota bacterium]